MASVYRAVGYWLSTWKDWEGAHTKLAGIVRANLSTNSDHPARWRWYRTMISERTSHRGLYFTFLEASLYQKYDDNVYRERWWQESLRQSTNMVGKGQHCCALSLYVRTYILNKTFLVHRSGWDDMLMSFKLRILYPWLISWAVHKYKSEQKHYKCLFDVGYFPLFVYCVGQTSCNGCARASGFWCKTLAFLV